MSDRWPALTGLRGLAALAVVLVHAYTLGGQAPGMPRPLAWFFSSGWSGVDVFFTLSAFLLTLPFARAQAGLTDFPVLGSFFRRRFVRILPAYYVQMAILLALGWLGLQSAVAWRDATPGIVVGHVAFLYNLVPGFEPHLPLWWTLPVELGFYLLLPLFAYCLRPQHWGWLLAGIVASLGFRFWLMDAGLPRNLEVAWIEHLPGRLHQFLIGVLAAALFVQLQLRHRLPRARIADFLALAAILVFTLLPGLGLLASDHAFAGGPVPNPVLLCWHLFASIAVACLLVALASDAPRACSVFAWPPLRALGLISYSLYLWHYPVMLGVREALGGYQAAGADFWLFFFYSLLFSLPVAAASWWLVERPVQRWGR